MSAVDCSCHCPPWTFRAKYVRHGLFVPTMSAVDCSNSRTPTTRLTNLLIWKSWNASLPEWLLMRNHLWIPNLLWEYHICGCIVCHPNWWSLWKDTWSYFCTSIRDLMQWTLISLLVWPTKTHNTSWKRCWLRFGSGQSYQSFPKTRRWLAPLLKENIFSKHRQYIDNFLA